MTPFHQGPSISLTDAICWILLKSQHRRVASNMPEIIEKINTEFPSIAITKHMSATVHKALGTLIKERKVYYTGAGYFLVVPEHRKMTVLERMRWPRTCCNSTNWSMKSRRDISSQTESLTSCLDQPSESMTTCLPRAQSQRKLWSKPTNVNGCDFSLDPLNCYNIDQDEETKDENMMKTDLLPDSRRSQNQEAKSSLQRSQSLRISKDAKAKLEVGGSLKLSKSESIKLQKYFESAESSEQSSRNQSHVPRKPVSRRDSIISKFFSNKKKKEIKTFSDQFPPPPQQFNTCQANHQHPGPGNDKATHDQPVITSTSTSSPSQRASSSRTSPGPRRKSLSQLHLARTLPSSPSYHHHQRNINPKRLRSPPARKCLKYSSLSSASSSPTSGNDEKYFNSQVSKLNFKFLYFILFILRTKLHGFKCCNSRQE